VQPGQVV